MITAFSTPYDCERTQRETSAELAQQLTNATIDSDRVAQLLQILLNLNELRMVRGAAAGAQQ